MSATWMAKAREHALASGAKPRLEERVRERGWRPTCDAHVLAELCTEAVRRCAIAVADMWPLHSIQTVQRGHA
jgi:hypothetical protein